MEFALVPAGDFQMGSPNIRIRGREDEHAHRVRISRPFLLGAYEVTQEEYQKVMETNPSWFSPDGGGKDRIKGMDANHFPVEQVSWFDAIEFCNRLSKLDGYDPYYDVFDVKDDGKRITSAKVKIAGGRGYRLPTEAEWEYACRARTTTDYHFGYVRTGKEANFKTIISGGYGGPDTSVFLDRTVSVGSYKPNNWGLYDMHGNVAEWCWDWYGANYYEKSPDTDPQGPADTQHRLLRGGSWITNHQNARSATRFSHAPAEVKDYTGFRVARTP
jgi:formylglycine-generating enzyme required for sulfatase activity